MLAHSPMVNRVIFKFQLSTTPEPLDGSLCKISSNTASPLINSNRLIGTNIRKSKIEEKGMKLITSEKSGYRWVSSKHSFKNTILTFTNSVPSSFEIEMCSEVTCKVPLLIAGHILKFPCHIITRVFLYFHNLRTVFSDQRTFLQW